VRGFGHLRNNFLYYYKINVFEGKHYPKEAREWIKRMERVSKAAPCYGEDKMVFDVHMLNDAAGD